MPCLHHYTPLTRRDLDFELSEPATGDLGESEPRRERQLAESASPLQHFALPQCLDECCGFERAKARPSVDPHAHGVLAVRLLVDAARDTTTPIRTTARCHRLLLLLCQMSQRRIARLLTAMNLCPYGGAVRAELHSPPTLR